MSDVLDKISLYMEDGQLLVGNQASSPRAAPLYPEYDYGFILDELDDFEFRSSDAFRISKENKEIVRQTLPWWENKTLKARAVSMQTKEALEDRSVGVLGWQGNITSEEGHIVPDYENVLKKGFTGLLQEVKELMDQLDMAIPSDLSKMTFYRACKIVLEGCLNYVTRCRDMIREKLSICSDRQRISELEKMEKRCSALLEHAPETFAEALQFIWFIHVMP